MENSRVIFALHVAACILLAVADVAHAQNQTQATTEPSEVLILNSVWSKWGLTPQTTTWNISGEPCSGAAIDSTTFDTYNPFIKCDCSSNNSTTCHITQLKVYAMSVAGPIPDELWNLTYLFNLNLGQNLLTGSLSPSIGNLTRMQYLNLGINALSGELPRQLGLLTELIVLGFGTNNFNGSLPSELGNLSKMQQLYFDSSGVSGEVPSSFSNLKSLNQVWASDNNLTGQIPEFIGNWSQLTQLILQGNSFEGPIPSTFSNLTALKDLRISDVSNGSSSLEFIRNMKNLSILILRNNNISDSLPSDFAGYGSLSQLDLSFNKLTGQIPNSLFNLSSLTYLFLGNNSLSGTLPEQKSSSLLNIDVSFNNLMGSFPSWVSNDLQLNLVGNNFTLDNSNSGLLPSGLNCLQRNFPCNRGTGIYYNFAVKCGGPQITSSSNIVYEMDNNTLGPATYYVSNTERWAVSNVGYFTGNNNPAYKASTLSQFTNTLDSELFQTARLSASSLRYYGLGLENGNYNVTLQFAEIQILNTGWQSLGRRLFDVYIQGNLVSKDFDIQKEAGGASLTAVRKVYQAQVTANYLEIHFFWAGKGTCCVPNQATYGPLVSAISAVPDFIPTVSNNPPTRNKDHIGLIVGVATGVGVVGLMAVLLFFYLARRRKMARTIEDQEFLGIDTRPYTFSYAELKAATDDFNTNNKLGEGGFGPVFKGTLNDGRVIAVKQLSVSSHQGKNQFVAEIATISAVQHRNLVKLYGCCIDADNRLLVYEYLENKSLDQAMFGQRNLNLDWATRCDVCLGVARGLAYLHEESRLRIVHRDVKASNILLDSDLTPKISDFGLAKLYDDKKTHISTRVAGTIGYLAPEYAMRGHLTEKADVFAFGVVALEVVSGRPNSDPSLEEGKRYLLEWAWNLHETNRVIELVDSRLPEFNEDEAKRMVAIGLLCTQTSPTLRPQMSRVVAMLSGDIEVPTVSTRPGYLTEWRFNDGTSFLTENTDMSTDKSSYNPASTASTVDGANHSLVIAATPMLDEIIGEGR
ncbi:probable LRR receptor-like serine/threonine-protein kinase At1g56140 isoform X1 [Rhodamnia argentea]|uniref:non-specific serine/threonine protein kinase n=1 Tax=Rhodamnia argentea TaxID=178133 RepID=A0A8B8NZF3_9MYRT|nr:probable LRR receptor-like serine/threonine-protein kinase At1g56140 isoform X1 [Rhodamnia argentea]XP_048130082.1 probable LRR receptor-like serine/threonine-protein kinase At1g56140 isoform X1 [Rhodamnia argentea]